MNENLTFKEDKLFTFLFAKIVELQTEVCVQGATIEAFCKHLKPDETNFFDLIQPLLKEQEAVARKRFVQLFSDELKIISNDYDDLIQSFLNLK